MEGMVCYYVLIVEKLRVKHNWIVQHPSNRRLRCWKVGGGVEVGIH